MRKLSVVRGMDTIKPIYDVMRSVTNRAWIAGGYAAYCVSEKSEPPMPGDIDIFPQSEKEFEKLGDKYYTLAWQVDNSERAVTFLIAGLPDVQIIRPGNTRWTPRKLVNDFDFTVCRAVLLSPTCVLVDDLFCSDTSKSRLRVVNINHPIGAFMRIAKYSAKGYEVAPSEIVKVLDNFNQGSPESKKKMLDEFRNDNWESWEQVRDQEPFFDDDWDDDDRGYSYY